MLEMNRGAGDCFVCNRRVEKGEGYRIHVRGRGKRVFCRLHALSAEGYHRSEQYRAEKVGTEKKSSLAKTTIGIEWEMENIHDNYALYREWRSALERAGFCAEHDGSLEDGEELPSPTCEGV